jgi:hypothetical protein
VTYLQHVEIKPHEWARIWAETAPQKLPWPPPRQTSRRIADHLVDMDFSTERIKRLYANGIISRSVYRLSLAKSKKEKRR